MTFGFLFKLAALSVGRQKKVEEEKKIPNQETPGGKSWTLCGSEQLVPTPISMSPSPLTSGTPLLTVLHSDLPDKQNNTKNGTDTENSNQLLTAPHFRETWHQGFIIKL